MGGAVGPANFTIAADLCHAWDVVPRATCRVASLLRPAPAKTVKLYAEYTQKLGIDLESLRRAALLGCPHNSTLPPIGGGEAANGGLMQCTRFFAIIGLATCVAAPAYGQPAPGGGAAEHTDDAPALTLGGTLALASDYRFRGVSQTDRTMSVQGSVTAVHASGVYAGVWAANLSGWGTFGGANMELDLFGGVKTRLSDAASLDAGLTWYMYPGGAAKSDFGEVYAKLSVDRGPAAVTIGAAYAPRQQALGRWYRSGAGAAAGVYDDPGDKQDNLYLWGEAAVAIPGAPLTAKAHLGHSWGNDGLGPNGTSVTPTGSYWDWSLGFDAAWRNLTLGAAYVDTDISRGKAAYLQPGFSKGQDGTGAIAGGTVVVSLTAAF